MKKIEMTEKINFLIVAKKDPLEELFGSVCKDINLSYHFSRSFDEALQSIDSYHYQFIFVDLEDEDLRPLQFLEWLQTRQLYSKTGIVFDKSYRKEFLQAVAMGATEYICSEDLNTAWLKSLLLAFVRRDKTHCSLKSFGFTDALGESFIWVGVTPEMRRIFEQALVLGELPLPLLIKGEKGVGKTHLARLMNRRHAVFRFDAAEIAEYDQKSTILEPLQEYLGERDWQKHEEVQFSLVIENIELLHEEIQEQLAEYFKTRMLNLGLKDSRDIKVMMQLIATTSGNLPHLVNEGVFRQDLLLLLEKNSFYLPVLKDRAADISSLVEHFINIKMVEGGVHYFAKDALTALISYDWPENISELRDTVSEIVCSNKESLISSKLLPGKILEKSFYTSTSDDGDLSDVSYNEAKRRILDKFNHNYIVELLRKSDNNLTVAAEKAGMDRSNFKKIIKKYGVGK